MKWRRVPLANVLASLESGSRPRGGATAATEGIPSLGGEHLDAEGGFRLDNLRYIPRSHFDGMSQGVVRTWDILVVKDGATTGKTSLVRPDFPLPRAAVNEHVFILRVDAQVADPSYVFYFLFSPQGQVEILRDHRGATIGGISREFVTLVCIPLPPLSEQRRIVEILDQADRLRRLRAEADAKADRILPALFIKMFGDPATNPMGWPVVPLGELAVLGPQYGANARSAPREPGAPRYIRITDILDDGRLSDDEVGIDLVEWEPYLLEEGDLLFARSGATVGKTYVHRMVENPCVFAGYLIRFRLAPDRLHPLVAFSFTQTTAYRAWVASKRRTAAQPNINGQDYAGLMVPVPDRQVQRRFVKAYARFEAARNSLQSSRRRLDTLFSMLLRSGFDGSLTASWREAHMKELLQEMEQQAKALEATKA